MSIDCAHNAKSSAVEYSEYGAARARPDVFNQQRAFDGSLQIVAAQFEELIEIRRAGIIVYMRTLQTDKHAHPRAVGQSEAVEFSFCFSVCKRKGQPRPSGYLHGLGAQL